MRQPSIQKIFITLSLGTAIFFLIVSGVLLQNNSKEQLPLYELSGLFSFSLTTDELMHFFEVEIPYFSVNVQANKQKKKSDSDNFLSKLFSFNKPNQWIAQEIPVMSTMDMSNFTASTITDSTTKTNNEIQYRMESNVPDDFLIEETKQVQALQTKKDVVFIYHTHNRESFLPETKQNYDKQINITNVGQELGKELERLGLKTIVSTKDYQPELERFSLAYKSSLKTVQTALKENNDYQFIFDLHRDAPPGGKKSTTKTIKGKDYALVTFVIGTGNKNYQRNKELALKIDERLNKLYPGISKGINVKEKNSGSNGEYNQSVSSKSVLIEIGGNYNTLEEEYRTARAIAEAVADIYWEAEKVDAKVE